LPRFIDIEAHDKSPHALDKYVDLKTAWIQL